MTDQVTDRADTATDADGDARPHPDPDTQAAAAPDAAPSGAHRARSADPRPDDGTNPADPDATEPAVGAGHADSAGSVGSGATRAGESAGAGHAESAGSAGSRATRAAESAGAGHADSAGSTGTRTTHTAEFADGHRNESAGVRGDGVAGADGRGDGAAATVRDGRAVEVPEARADLADLAEPDAGDRATAVAEAKDGGAALPADVAVPRPLVSPDGRDPHLDNVKFVAIVLVVAGHAWGPMLAWSHALQGVYLFLYTIHMPIFVMLSGYFSRHFTASPRQARGLLRAVVVPYLLIESAFTLFRYFGDGQQLNFALQDPWWVSWFLMTLFFWRLSAPLWRVVRFPLVIAVVVSLAAGSKELTGTFELGRMLQYLPFFVLGLSLRQEHFARLRSTWARIVAIPVLGGALYLAYVVVPHAGVEWVYWRHGYEYLGVSYPVFAGIKIAQLALTVLVIAAVIALVPARRIPVVTTFGAASMYAYLLHGFVTKGADWWGLYDLPFLHSHLGIAIVGLGSVVLTLVLCSPPVRVLFSWAIQPRLEGWLRGTTPR